MSGPLQVIAMSFGPDSDFRGRVLAEVDRLQGRGVLRLLDLMFVSKTEDGTVERIVMGDEDFGALLSTIVPVNGAGPVEPAAASSLGFETADARALADSLPPGTALAFLLVEHGWAQPLFDAINETGGELVGEGFLTAEAGLMVGAEVAAMEEAAQVIAAAHAAELDATLRAIEAETRAAEAVAASEAIRAAAAADALRALIRAGIIEDQAAHEAMDALDAAGLIIAAADEAAAEAVAEDAAEVMVADQAAATAVAEDEAATAVADEVAADAVAAAAATVGAASISVAEARVLRYLPTPLTFALIAHQLGISRSAAKDRAERLYHKLGVHSRAEAVARARALGLIA
jgi:DNA-binding CsgD family transcriptional regulator